MQKLNPEISADNLKELELENLINNQGGDQFSFNSNMNTGNDHKNSNNLEPINAMR